MNYWENKCVIVTGGTSGLGRNLVLKLVNMGAKVAFCGRSKEKMDDVLNELKEEERNNIFYDTFEITEEDKISSFVKNAEEKLGTIDVLINCAGANTARALVEDIEIKDIDLMLKVNMIAPLIFIKECYKYMKVKKEGLVVNILSTCCLFSNEGIAAYTASKSGLDSLTKVFRKEARKNNVRVCSVYPGGINTTFRAQEREEYLSADKTADAILKSLDIDSDVALDEIVLRPFVETNYC
ncbi:SDR family NAD(P)-dependent oxidoreductase [Clostridium sp.]|uniref:SDR family oxidoreductase n=1 Tax=Clostridium sp. TaxID=1506 RepID=UPI00284758FD|nr:SDR family NAD(P)-dependent oxidoreductase [Clostridium sp.]MDR3596740.1 SDR family NAD(P)-dependent oxidoreductase [Clostridium sp.]